MITAKEARILTNDKQPVYGSDEFNAVMAGVERIIRKAISDGHEEVEIISHTLQELNGCKFPKCVNIKNKVDCEYFWWPYVKTELKKNGFKISNTVVCDHYIIAW